MQHLPVNLREQLASYAPRPAAQGESGARLTQLVAFDRPTLFLKSGTTSVADDIAAEYVRLRWLQGRIPCPRIVAYTSDATQAVLVTSALPGLPAYDYLMAHPVDVVSVVQAIVALLRRLHAIPVCDCPFDATLSVRVSAARRNVIAGLVDEQDFGALHHGMSAAEVLRALERDMAAGLALERVVTHGDFSLGNVLVHDGQVTGVIDVGRVGVADPYQDLAILHDNLAEFGTHAQQALWRSYGIECPDEARLVAHLRLDELF